MSFIYQKQQAHAFFSRPGIQRRIPASFRDLLIPLLYELCDNAFRHGRATHFNVICEDNVIYFEDNGMDFNPVTQLDRRNVSVRSHIGSLIFHTFCKEFAKELTVEYEKDASNQLNRLCLRFSQPTWTLERHARMEIPVNISMVTTRETAERLAATIPLPTNAQSLVVSIEGMCSPSAITEFIGSLAQRVGDNVLLTVYVPLPEAYLVGLREWFPQSRVILRPRL